MFRTAWAFLEAKSFYAMYGPDRIDQLERERGLHIAHTYLDTYHKKGTAFGMRNVLVPADKGGVPGGPGAVKLDPRMDALLATLEAHQARGALWVPTLAQLADRMRLVGAITLTPKENSIVVHADKPVPGATFVVPRAVKVTVGDHAPRGVSEARDETTFWDDLPAGDTTIALAPK
jgi:hypothetical protein